MNFNYTQQGMYGILSIIVRNEQFAHPTQTPLNTAKNFTEIKTVHVLGIFGSV
jgi:hypothetical protein